MTALYVPLFTDSMTYWKHLPDLSVHQTETLIIFLYIHRSLLWWPGSHGVSSQSLVNQMNVEPIRGTKSGWTHCIPSLWLLTAAAFSSVAWFDLPSPNQVVYIGQKAAGQLASLCACALAWVNDTFMKRRIFSGKYSRYLIPDNVLLWTWCCSWSTQQRRLYLDGIC